jgi:hypothetical protein
MRERKKVIMKRLVTFNPVTRFQVSRPRSVELRRGKQVSEVMSLKSVEDPV